MEEKSREILEYNRIKDFLVKRAKSGIGKEFCEKIKPEDNIKKIEEMLGETEESVNLILAGKSLLIDEDMYDIRKILERVKIGGILACNELIGLLDFLNVSKKINYILMIMMES